MANIKRFKRKQSSSFLKLIFIAAIYSLFFLCSEYTYRVVFDITAMRSLTESYLFIFIFTILMLTTKYRISSFFIWLFFTISIIANNIHQEYYRSWINSTNYLLLFVESGEVMNAGLSILPKFIIPFLWGTVESLVFASLIYFKSKKFILSDLLFYSLILFICVRSFYTTQQHGISPNPDYSRLKVNYFTFGYFIGKTLPYHVFSLSNVESYHADEPVAINDPKIKNIILVMGESQNTQNMSYFGYSRDTTPFFNYLGQHSNAIIKPTYSAGVMTAVALPSFFNAIEKPNGMLQISTGKTNLFQLAQKQGYYTQFHTAQAEQQMMIMNLIGLSWIDEMTYPNHIGYSNSDNMPDQNLLAYLDTAGLDDRNNLIVLHQRGSHVPYGGLLTEEEKVFGKDTVIDNYDNTILKTDQLLKQIFQYLEARNKDDWILIFTSDHGQNVSNETFNHGGFTPSSYTVPVMIFTPNTQIQQNIIDTTKECDHLFHQQISTLIISLMGYNTPISDCKLGYINSNQLSGDSGYLQVNQETGQMQKIYAN
ncbi:sulfatase-like hydrolase/transferase [Orbaceae bacterium ac157xtp]